MIAGLRNVGLTRRRCVPRGCYLLLFTGDDEELMQERRSADMMPRFELQVW